MRIFFLCFFLGTLVWFFHQTPDAAADPTVYIGFLLVFPSVLARVLAALRMPPSLGAFIAAIFLSFSGLIPRAVLEPLLPYSSLAIIWVGLHLGLSCSTIQIRNLRLLLAAGLVVLASLLTTFSILLVFDLPLDQTLQISCLAGFSAPLFFLLNEKKTAEAYPLSLLTSLFSFLLLALVHLLEGRIQEVFPNPFQRWDYLIFMVAIELVVLSFRQIRTRPGRYILLGLTACLILLAAWIRNFSPLTLSLMTGFALSLRFHTQRGDIQITQVLAAFLVPFVLADFVLRLEPVGLLSLTSGHWQFLVLYTLAMAGDKFVGTLLTTRVTGIPLQNQLSAHATLCLSLASRDLRRPVPGHPNDVLGVDKYEGQKQVGSRIESWALGDGCLLMLLLREGSELVSCAC